MRAPRLGLVGIAIVATASGACGRSGALVRAADVGSLRGVGVGSPLDPTVRPAHIVPEYVDESGAYGTEPGGGTRAITAGLRVVTTSEGGIEAAADRLPQAPASTTALPERLGGGFLFVLGSSVWRADRWLGPAKPIYTSPQPIAGVVPGLDRVYLRGVSAYSAIDGKTGKALDLGPWPASPYVASFAAADGWRAAAVTDLRGVVTTFDAGATWHVLDLPMDPRVVLASGDGIAVGGVEDAKCQNVWFGVRADGSVARMSAAPREAKGKAMSCTPGTRAYYGGYPGGYYPTYPQPTPQPAPQPTAAEKETPKEEAPSLAVRIFGKRPIAAAIEDGWPLTDGTALVARDGALGRIRLADGAVTEVVPSAYPLKPSRCHAVSLTRPNAVGAFGFVCGEPRGATVIYAYDPMRGSLSELKHFDRPRTVTSSGNGALAVRGACAEDADVTPPASTLPKSEALKDEKERGKSDDKADDKANKSDKSDTSDKSTKAGEPDAADAPAKPAVTEVHPFCVLGYDNVWREVHVRSDVGGERVVVLADGKMAVLSPPEGQTAAARLTILDKGRATTVPIVFPRVTADVARVLRLGLWLDGFEERRPGVLGGWIEAGGVMLGLEIGLDGKATPGQYIRDAGMPFVSGRYGFGWTSSRRGYETTDGGMTWTSVDLPEPIVPLNRVDRRACGPIGCVAAGWLRVGWGDTHKKETPQAPPVSYRSSSVSPPSLTLACEPTAPVPATPPAPRSRPQASTPTPKPSMPSRRSPFGGPPVLAAGSLGQTDLPPFYATPATPLREAERGVNFDVQDLPEHYPKLGSLGRIYAWGPKGGDWDTLGRWQVKWLSPFAGWPEVHASVPVLPPQFVLDFTKTGSPYGYPGYYSSYYSGLWQLASGDDPSHALLFARRITRTDIVLVELEADRAPVEIRRADGEPFLELDGVVRAAGRWFVSTPPAPGAFPPVTTIWQIDGAVARELARVPRAGIGEAGRGQTTHLARRSDNRSIGLVVDGQPTAERNATVRWVLPIDLESGQLGEPEALGYTDLGGRTLDACGGDVAGWILDASLPGSSVSVRLGSGSGTMHSAYARMRLTSSHACLERVAGMWSGQSAERASQLTRPGAPRGAPTAHAGEILATALAAQNRYPLRCTVVPR